MSQLEEIRARHRKINVKLIYQEAINREGPPQWECENEDCPEKPWPCDAAILISELERQQKLIQDLTGALLYVETVATEVAQGLHNALAAIPESQDG